MKEYTLFMIKPNATAKNKIGEILAMVEKEGFIIEAMQMITFNHAVAEAFYNIHKGKPFFDKLLDFIMSGKTVAAVLSKKNAIEDLRKLVGNTNPEKADPGTIRALYGDSLTFNAVHASDSDEHAHAEIEVLFLSRPFKFEE